MSYPFLWIRRRIHWKFTETLIVLREESNNFSLESDCSIKESLFEGKVIGGQESFGLPLVHKESPFSLLNPFQIQGSF